MITPIQMNYNYYGYINKSNKKENISFGAVPLIKNRLAENKIIMGSIAGAVTAIFAAIAQIYSKAESPDKPLFVSREEFIDILGIDREKFSYIKWRGYVVGTEDDNDLYDLNNEQNKQTLYKAMGKTVSVSEIAKLSGTDSGTIKYHIKQGRIKLNQDKLVDLADPINRYFIENYERHNVKSIPVTEEELPEITKSIPLEYCIKRGLVTTDEKGKVDLANPDNQKFLKACKKGRISIRDYVVSKVGFGVKAHKSIDTIKRDIRNERIDTLDPVNAAYIAKNQEGGRNRNSKEKLTNSQVCRMIGLNSPRIINYYVQKGYMVREEDGLIDITKEPNKTFISKKLTFVPKCENYKRR